ncbi:60S ribosomal protein L39-1 [Camellia lanceoleosa]|nr:60S ribosomal protein L39-1 [Camellia lanceoleosa]
MIKKKLAKKVRQNRPIPHWIRMRIDNTIRYPLTLLFHVAFGTSNFHITYPLGGFAFGFVEFEVESAVHFEVEFWLYTYEMPHVTGIKPDLLSWVYNVGDWGKAGGCQKTMILIYFLVESHHKQSRV